MLRAILGIVAAAALAGPAAAIQQDQPETGPEKAEKKICRDVELVGSRARAVKVCRTAAEWRQMSDRGRESLDSVQTPRTPPQ